MAGLEELAVIVDEAQRGVGRLQAQGREGGPPRTTSR